MRKIALIVTTMSVALLAYYGFMPAPVGKVADAELSIDPLKLHSAVHPVSLPTQSYDPFSRTGAPAESARPEERPAQDIRGDQ
jgi:hypothetical protein